MDIVTAAQRYKDDGIVSFDRYISDALCSDLLQRINAIFEGKYSTGIPPKFRTCSPDDAQVKMCRLSFPQTSDPEITQLLTETGLGKLVHEVTDEPFVQGWFIHALRKIPGQSNNDVNYVGWHQDEQYTHPYFLGDFMTAWISLTDVTEDSGPVRYVEGSHKIRPLAVHEGSGFSHTDGFEQLREKMKSAVGIEWEEKVHLAPRGTISLHHSRLVHGSDVATKGPPRVTLVIHLRFKRNRIFGDGLVQPRKEYSFSFYDENTCPVLYKQE